MTAKNQAVPQKSENERPEKDHRAEAPQRKKDVSEDVGYWPTRPDQEKLRDLE